MLAMIAIAAILAAEPVQDSEDLYDYEAEDIEEVVLNEIDEYEDLVFFEEQCENIEDLFFEE